MNRFARFILFCLFALLAQNAFAQQQVLLDQVWAPVLDGAVQATALDANGKLLVSGSFTTVNGTARPGLARLNADGTLDTSFAASLQIRNNGGTGLVYSIVPLPGGQILIGGTFDQVGSPTLQMRHGVARLSANGSLDVTNFIPPNITPYPDGRRVFRLLRLSSGKILIGGHFLDANGNGYAKLARLFSDGTLDTTFVPVNFGSGSPYVWALAEQADGKLLVGGAFSSVDGVTHNNLVRLQATGALDYDFPVGVNGSVSRILVRPNGDFAVAGSFTQITNRYGASFPASAFANVDANLSVSNGGGVNANIHWMEAQVDDKILIGGDFTSSIAFPEIRSKLARTSFYSTLVDSFAPPTIAGGSVWTLVQAADGSVTVGGNFTTVGGVARNYLARLRQWDSSMTFDKVSAGVEHTCIIRSGAAKCWGRNSDGQLGNNSTTDSATPVQVVGLTSGVTAISAGVKSACAIHNGAAKCWGSNSDGQLGNNSTTDSVTPVQVVGLTSGVTAISAAYSGGVSYASTCAIHNDAAKCWGNNVHGQLGNNTLLGSSTPVQVTGLTSGVTAISAGDGHTCAIESGAAKCWGAPGNAGTTDPNTRKPVQVLGLTSGVTAISAGAAHTCAIQSGAAKCWGYNSFGALGDGTTTERIEPVQVQGLTAGVTAISAGEYYTCSIVNIINNSNLRCWGENDFGQLGDGTTTDSLIPVISFPWISALPPAPGTYTVSPSTSGGFGTISPDAPQSVVYGNTSSFLLTPEPGYYVRDVIGTCGGTLNGNVFTTVGIAESCTVIARFTNQPIVTPSVIGSGSIAPNVPQVVTAGSSKQFILYPAPGKVVTVTGTCDGELSYNSAIDQYRFDTEPVTTSCTVIANFTPGVTITPSVQGGGGIVNPDSPQLVAQGAQVKFNIYPNGNDFVGTVGGTCGGTLAYGFLFAYFTTMPAIADCTVIFNFSPGAVTHLVTPSVTGNGSIFPHTPRTVIDGSVVSFALTPDADNDIASVTGTCGGTLDGSLFTTHAITDGCTVIANFTSDTHTVTPSVAGGNGSISPSTPQTVNDGATTQFTLNPASGYHAAQVTGNCGGTLVGNVFTTTAIIADCTVIAQFASNDTPLTISVDDQRQYATYGVVLDYLVTVTNTGNFVATGVSVSSVVPPQLDAANASWSCVEPDAGVICAPSGSGMLNTSGVVIPPGDSVRWIVLAMVRDNAPGDRVEYTVTATGSSVPDPVSITDSTVLVLFRNSFDGEEESAGNLDSTLPEERR